MPPATIKALLLYMKRGADYILLQVEESQISTCRSEITLRYSNKALHSQKMQRL